MDGIRLLKNEVEILQTTKHTLEAVNPLPSSDSKEIASLEPFMHKLESTVYSSKMRFAGLSQRKHKIYAYHQVKRQIGTNMHN